MKEPVLFFGQLTDITATNQLVVEPVANTDELIRQLLVVYPGLAGASYVIAVDKKIINGNTALNEHSSIALLPPFSGG